MFGGRGWGRVWVVGWASVILALPLSGQQEVTNGAPPADGPAETLHVSPAAGDPAHARGAPRALAVPLAGTVELDGRLDEAVWRDAPAVDRFLQRQPNPGRPATQRTEVRFAYDGETLYVGARMFDELGAAGVTSRLVRRDRNVQSDELRLTFDTYHDHRGRTIFRINPAGVRGDAYGPGGSSPDPSWDPVWRAAARVDSAGWTVELAIPFAQLRFPHGMDQEWGLQVERTVHRLNEEQVWAFWPLNEQGGPSRFGHLAGIAAPARGTHRLEVLPYAVSQLDVAAEVDPSDPFGSERSAAYRVGADAKVLLTSNLTLTATVNPDFGQAEVDPAVVNLSAFETFFPEKREFFIEGRGVFSFGNFWCYFCSNTSSLDMLFTRRIGRSPQAGFLARQAGEHADVPDASTILGAAKMTGRVGGTTVGLLSAVTARERARVATAEGDLLRQEVEPATHYFAGRVKRDLLDGDLQVGAIATSVARDFDDPALRDHLTSHAEGLGVDAEYWWADRTYHLLFSGAVTQVSGSEAALDRLQRSSARYLQRPDREGGGNGLFTGRYDPGLTAMRGYGLYTRLAKDGGDFRWETAANVRSPGFENNDIAFLTRTDFVWMNANLQRGWTAPTSWYREAGVVAGAQQQFNFDGDLTGRQVHGALFVQTPFYWDVRAFYIRRLSTLDDRLTRGGPVVRRPAAHFVAGFLSTDRRRPVSVSVEPNTGWNEEGARDWRVAADVSLRPRSNVALSVGPSYSVVRSTDQFVTSVADPTAEAFFGRRYVFADLEQRTLSARTRLDITFSPGMTLELFAQPFISANAFSRYKEFREPRGLAKDVFGEDVGTARVEGEGFERRVVVDPDGQGPAEAFSFPQGDFNLRSLRGNVVFRWEYTPGSTLFLVWTQDRRSADPFGDLELGRDRRALFGADADHTFLVKVSYWMGF